MSFFKKALGVFVEFDEDQNKDTTSSPSFTPLPTITGGVPRGPENLAEAEKFEKYFNNLFDKANFPGPDYFEFYKTMETLEAHIKDENALVAATFSSLAIQGLTKKKLLDTAHQYKDIIEQDHKNFDRALDEKMKAEVGQREVHLQKLTQEITSNSEKIQALTKEISEMQTQMGKLKTELLEQENKLTKNKQGYQVASQAVLNKIATDIKKIETIL